MLRLVRVSYCAILLRNFLLFTPNEIITNFSSLYLAVRDKGISRYFFVKKFSNSAEDVRDWSRSGTSMLIYTTRHFKRKMFFNRLL